MPPGRRAHLRTNGAACVNAGGCNNGRNGSQSRRCPSTLTDAVAGRRPKWSVFVRRLAWETRQRRPPPTLTSAGRRGCGDRRVGTHLVRRRHVDRREERGRESSLRAGLRSLCAGPAALRATPANRHGCRHALNIGRARLCSDRSPKLLQAACAGGGTAGGTGPVPLRRRRCVNLSGGGKADDETGGSGAGALVIAALASDAAPPAAGYN